MQRGPLLARFVRQEGGVDFCILLGAVWLAGQWAWDWRSAGPVLVAVALCIASIRRRARLGAWQLGALAVVMVGGAWRARSQIVAFERARELGRQAVEHLDLCEGRAEVVSSPILVHAVAAPGVVVHEPPPPALVWTGAASSVVCGERRLASPTLLRLYGGPSTLARGDLVDFVADLGVVEMLRNVGVDDPRPRAARRGAVLSGTARSVEVVSPGGGLQSWIDRQRARVRARIEATFVPSAAPLARALVLGETDLNPGDDTAFRASGLAHLLAVSGTHLVFAVVTAVQALRALLVRVASLAGRWDVGRAAAAFGILLAWVYADFAGGSGSARRAAAMLSVAFLARAAGRLPSPTRSFGLSLLGGAAADPLASFDASFVLSVAATAGMLLLCRPLAHALLFMPPPDRGAPPDAPPLQWRLAEWMRTRAERLSSSLAVTLAATVACTPYLALLAPSLPVGGLFANVLAAPVGEFVALPLCLAHGLLAPWPLVERGAAVVASGSLLVVRAVAHSTAELAWLAVRVPCPTPWQLALVGPCVTWLWWSPPSRRLPIALATAAVWVLLEVGAVHAGTGRGRLRVTFLDVGQGDSALIDLPSGEAMLVDAGGALGGGLDPGRAAVAPVLRSLRRSRLDVVVLSHPHPDHLGGFQSVLGAVSVGEFWDTGQGRDESAGPVYQRLLDELRARDVRIRSPEDLCGSHTIGGATVDVLAPCPSWKAEHDANDNSFVLRLRWGHRAALLAGDTAFASEGELLALHEVDLRADVLKVGHHGSRTSTSSAWLDAIRPEHAVISAGARNRFGHPSAATLHRLEAVATTVWRTDRHGAIRWETDGEHVSLSAVERNPMETRDK